MDKFDWNDIAIFVPAPRQMSNRRIKQLLRHYLPKGNIVLGISREKYVIGFEDQEQFRMLEMVDVHDIAETVMRSGSKGKLFLLEHGQAEVAEIFSKLNHPQRVLLVNGSWMYNFHNQKPASVLNKRGVKYKFISPFVDEQEAHAYEAATTQLDGLPEIGRVLTAEEMLSAASAASRLSYDYIFQTGAALGRKTSDGYELVALSFNKVIPYQARVLHEGSIREKLRLKLHDNSRYDTIHAEMMMLTDALSADYDLAGTTLFTNLMPCPSCAHTLSQTGISEFIYSNTHSDGYAAKLLEKCGKKVTQLQ